MSTVIILLASVAVVASNFRNPDCNQEQVSCFNCTHRKMCVSWFWGPLVPFGDPTPCRNSLTNYDLPYCDPDTNQCASYVPKQCRKDGALSCLREEPGDFYPDIRDCKKYYRCNSGNPTTQQCSSGMVYKQEWRKCVINLNSRRDCHEVTRCPEVGQVYPGDSSLYYKCSSGNSIVSLLACPSNVHLYDSISDSCPTSRCSATEPNQLLPIPYKCSAYYDCQSGQEVACPNGQGFNPRTNKCTHFYNNLCNELSLFENNVRSFLGGNFIFNFIDNTFNAINFSPYSLVFFLPYPDSLISTTIIVVDYLYKERSIPPGLIGFIVEFTLGLIPPQIRAILDMLLRFLPFNLPTARHLTTDQAIALSVEEEFTKINFREVAESVQEVYSVPESFQLFIRYVANRLNIPEEQLFGILQLVAPTLSETINNLFAVNNTKLLTLKNRDLSLDAEGVWQIVQGQLDAIVVILKDINEDVSEIFNDIIKGYAKQEYQFVRDITKEVHLPLHV